MGHRIYELRWLHNQQYLDDCINFWLHIDPQTPKPHLHAFSSWLQNAVYNRYLVNLDKDFLKKTSGRWMPVTKHGRLKSCCLQVCTGSSMGGMQWKNRSEVAREVLFYRYLVGTGCSRSMLRRPWYSLTTAWPFRYTKREWRKVDTWYWTKRIIL
ncbi:MGH1-like glycoside hydrolase domain-containing protein [Flavisolibacter nicotianae]|uniref:MGH1-like glycoside hydrolase domain-containing protein n=1 Tax=Flavisolibacter nicotianae TaxID=2364882 RepID=UPI000EAF2E79|nr:hypothetical protein [Flavisolibacter nicotianae]